MSDNDNSKTRRRGLRHKEDKGAFLPVVKAESGDTNPEFPYLEIPREKFDHVRVVLVEPKFSGNIGQTARVLRNFGFRRLALVRPRCAVDEDSEKMAVGAEHLLETIEIYDSIEDAVAGARVVVGATRRRGVQRRNVIDPRGCAELLEPVLSVGDVALVFGPEDSGLSNEDLAHCHWIASIPSGSDKPSFNLSHAVALFLYEITYALLLPLPRDYAQHENYEGMFDHMQRFLEDIGFLREYDKVRMMLVIRQMLYRGRFSEREVRIIRGIITQAYWRMAHPGEIPEDNHEEDLLDEEED